MKKALIKVISKCCVSVVNEKKKFTPQGKFLMEYGAPEKSRTPNLQIRSLALYPIELRALLSFPYFFYLVELLNKFEYHMSTTN